jgi:steroid delta-isomerase-like uncharacterized protein
MSAQDNAALARKLYDAFNRKDYDHCLSLVTEDMEAVLIPFGQTFQGRGGFNEFMQGFAGAFPDIKIQVTNQVATEDQVVNEFTARGTHTGTLMTPAGPITPTGRTVEFIVCEVYQIKDGKFASLRNYQDAASLMRQLGLIP